MSVKSEYDIEFAEGEISGPEDPYLIVVTEKDGSPASLSWADEIELIVSTKDFETVRFVAKKSVEGELGVLSNVLSWFMKQEQTSGYTGEHVAQIIATREDPKRDRKTYLMSVMVHPAAKKEESES